MTSDGMNRKSAFTPTQGVTPPYNEQGQKPNVQELVRRRFQKENPTVSTTLISQYKIADAIFSPVVSTPAAIGPLQNNAEGNCLPWKLENHTASSHQGQKPNVQELVRRRFQKENQTISTTLISQNNRADAIFSPVVSTPAAIGPLQNNSEGNCLPWKLENHTASSHQDLEKIVQELVRRKYGRKADTSTVPVQGPCIPPSSVQPCTPSQVPHNFTHEGLSHMVQELARKRFPRRSLTDQSDIGHQTSSVPHLLPQKVTNDRKLSVNSRLEGMVFHNNFDEQSTDGAFLSPGLSIKTGKRSDVWSCYPALSDEPRIQNPPERTIHATETTLPSRTASSTESSNSLEAAQIPGNGSAYVPVIMNEDEKARLSLVIGLKTPFHFYIEKKDMERHVQNIKQCNFNDLDEGIVIDLEEGKDVCDVLSRARHGRKPVQSSSISTTDVISAEAHSAKRGLKTPSAEAHSATIQGQPGLLANMAGNSGGLVPLANMSGYSGGLEPQSRSSDGRLFAASSTRQQERTSYLAGDRRNIFSPAAPPKQNARTVTFEEQIVERDGYFNCTDHGQVLQQIMAFEDIRAAADRSPRSIGMNTLIILDTSGSMAGQPFIEALNFITEFVNGLEEIQFNDNLNENVALAIFGKETRVIQHLTSDYTLIKQASTGLLAEGPSPLLYGLALTKCVMSMQTYKDHCVRGLCGINGHLIPPRVILITDGHISTTDDSLGTEERQDAAILKHYCYSINKRIELLTLHQVYCIPMGKADEDLPIYTGSKMMTSKDGQKMSRSFLHHSIAADLKRSCVDISDTRVIDRRMREVRTCCDHEDVARVQEILLQEEIDLIKADDNIRRDFEQVRAGEIR